MIIYAFLFDVTECINILSRVTCVVNAYTRILIGQAIDICKELPLTGLIIVRQFP